MPLAVQYGVLRQQHQAVQVSLAECHPCSKPPVRTSSGCSADCVALQSRPASFSSSLTAWPSAAYSLFMFNFILAFVSMIWRGLGFRGWASRGWILLPLWQASQSKRTADMAQWQIVSRSQAKSVQGKDWVLFARGRVMAMPLVYCLEQHY